MPFMGGSGFFPIITTLFWIWMLVDCIFNKNLRGGSKICWLLIIFFTNFVGALIYFFMECRHRNPIEALNYYANAFTKSTRSTAPPTPLYTPPSQARPPVYTPPISTPPASDYSDYTLGYRAQKSAPPAQASVPPREAAPAQAEYEDTIISYPEMPPPQQS